MDTTLCKEEKKILVSKIYSENAEEDSKHAGNKAHCRKEETGRLSENDEESLNFRCSVWEICWVKGEGT